MVVVLATAHPGASQVALDKNTLHDYYPLKVGTKWTYDIDTGTDQNKLQAMNQIAKIETIDGKSLARLETIVNGTVVASEHLSSTPEGIFRHRVNGVEVVPPVCILKYPFKERESWEAAPTIGPQHLKMSFRSILGGELTSSTGKYQTVSVTRRN